MLQSLHLKNYTLAKNLTVEFKNGFNVLTGESGSGKSVIVGSIELLLGARAQADVIRHNEDKASIEATFSIANLPHIGAYLKEEGFDDFGESLIIRREISKNGQNRVFVNDTPSTKQVLAGLTMNLIDLHGQHDHQHLLRESDHISFINSLMPDATLLPRYKKSYRNLQKHIGEYENLKTVIAAQKQRFELIEKQLDEINDAAISEDDEAELILEEKQLLAAEEILAATDRAENILSGDEQSLAIGIRELKRQFEFLKQFDPSYAESIEELHSVQAILDEASFTIQKTQNKTEINPQRLNDVQERLFRYEKLKRKYGNTVAEILSLAASIEAELEAGSNNEFNLTALEKTIKTDIAELKSLGGELSTERRKAKAQIERDINTYFERLGMPNAALDVRFKEVEATLKFHGEAVPFNEAGFELIEFWIRTNKGAQFLPLAKSASGGELSRIMLAFKSILAEKDNVTLLVFDEIDAGISGKISTSVGTQMKALASHHQIICITHSPQIASLAQYHYRVEKVEDASSTETQIKLLNEDERVVELASLLSTGTITDQSKQLASELLKGHHG
jgi:DNA repair protein RecN (Recombination protein N)